MSANDLNKAASRGFFFFFHEMDNTAHYFLIHIYVVASGMRSANKSI